MKCDMCDQEFANSEEVKRHKEQVHPMGEDAGEKPDLMETPGMNGMEPDSSEMPEARGAAKLGSPFRAFTKSLAAATPPLASCYFA